MADRIVIPRNRVRSLSAFWSSKVKALTSESSTPDDILQPDVDGTASNVTGKKMKLPTTDMMDVPVAGAVRAVQGQRLLPRPRRL